MGVASQNVKPKMLNPTHLIVLFSSGEKGRYCMAPRKISRVCHSCCGQIQAKICVHIAKVRQCLQTSLGFGCGISKSREHSHTTNRSRHPKRQSQRGSPRDVYPVVSLLAARSLCTRFYQGLHIHAFAAKPGLHRFVSVFVCLCRS